MADTAYTPRLRAEYDKSIRSKLTEQFGYANVMQVPRLDKVVLNMGVGEAVNDRKKVELAANDLALIAGQKPQRPKARKRPEKRGIPTIHKEIPTIAPVAERQTLRT